MNIPKELSDKFKGTKPWLLFLYLLFNADKNGHISTSYRTMTRDTGFSTRCICTAIKDMVSMGAIKVCTNRKRNASGTQAEQSTTIITICNYAFYVASQGTSGTQAERKRNKFDYSFVEQKFKESFEEWLKYKRAKNKMYKRQQDLELCYKKLIKYSNGNAEKAMNIVNQSISNNWDGFFELREKDTSSIVLKSSEMNYDKDKDW